MGGHSHHEFRQQRLNKRLGLLVGAVLLATIVAMVMLWPGSSSQSTSPNPGSAGDVVSAKVVSITPTPCAGLNVATASPDETCIEAVAVLENGNSAKFVMDATQFTSTHLKTGDQVKLMRTEVQGQSGSTTNYAFADFERGGKMLAFALLFMAIVIVVGRWRGVRALLGVGLAVAVLGVFMLPSMLDGNPPVLVASVGALAIMIIVLYLAHGISNRTTAALLGSIFGISFTAVVGLFATDWLSFTGLASVEESSLKMAVPGIDMNQVLTATIVIAGLGVLNDVTVAQSSAVWEMRALNPQLPKRRIYESAMRIGRDHIASSIYTLVFAYAGVMLVVLLLLYTNPTDLAQLVTSESIAQELIRTLIGSAGLVLSMPVTTLFAIWFTTAAESDFQPVASTS